MSITRQEQHASLSDKVNVRFLLNLFDLLFDPGLDRKESSYTDP